MTARFDGRSVFVTGGGNGIGRAAALGFAAEGGMVAIAEIAPAAGEAVAEDIRAAGGTALFIACDATDEEAVKQAIAAASEAHGPIRHAFNNIGAPRGNSIEHTTLAEWDWTVRISLTSVFLAMKHQIPVMRAGGGGTIVNTASNTATVYTPAAPPGYCAAKAAVIQLSHYASIQLGPDRIRVNSVSPGLTGTQLVLANLTPEVQHEVTSTTQVFPRLTRPEEIASAVLYLSSDEAAMVTGTDLEVGGGRVF